ncbi:hypothetical protein BASA61_003223 [Batrachochytrium salamandrivorans]|nr:hypothetical protein BASA61_003223 [Batrachochytrium salamandrivorans]
MLSRLIITFLCAATIGSVSGAFLTFHPAQFVLKDIAVYTSFTVKLNSKPTEDVKVYFQHQSMLMSKCMIVFSPANWDAPQYIDVIPVPLFLGTSLLPGPLEAESKVLATAVAAGPLPPSILSTDTMEVEQTLISTYQFKVVKCTEKQVCIKTVLVRYGSTAMSMDVSGSVKDISKYSMTYLTTSTNGIKYTPEPKAGNHMLNFPYGSSSMSLLLKIMVLHCNHPSVRSCVQNPDNLQPKPVDHSPPKPVDPVPPEPVDPIPPKTCGSIPPKPVNPVPPEPVIPAPPNPVDPVPPEPVIPTPPKPCGSSPTRTVIPAPPNPVDPVPARTCGSSPARTCGSSPPKPTTATTTASCYYCSCYYYHHHYYSLFCI